MESERRKSKILLLGLNNAGKTSIILSLQKKTNLMSFYSLNPTKKVEYVNLKDFAGDITILDFGGQEQYRKQHLNDLNKYLFGATKLIYVIDSQDIKNYEISLDYFKDILKHLEEQNMKIEIDVYLHKYDPDLEEKSESLVSVDIPNLKKKIMNLKPQSMELNI